MRNGFERLNGGLLDAAAVAGHLIPEGSMFAFLAAHRAEVFPDGDYADLFAPPGVGRRGWAGHSSGLRQDYMTHRPSVERAIAQVATWQGRRLRLRYRGTAKNDAWLKRRTAALNLCNLLGKGLGRRDGAWALAT